MAVIVEPMTDNAEIVDSYLEYLLHLEGESELLPTRENARIFGSCFLFGGAERGEPILKATVEGKRVGATFTTIAQPPLEYRYPYAMGHGTYVLPAWRKQGISKLLLERTREMLRQFGVNRQVGVVRDSNPASVANCLQAGFLSKGRYIEFYL